LLNGLRGISDKRLHPCSAADAVPHNSGMVYLTFTLRWLGLAVPVISVGGLLLAVL